MMTRLLMVSVLCVSDTTGGVALGRGQMKFPYFSGEMGGRLRACYDTEGGMNRCHPVHDATSLRTPKPRGRGDTNVLTG